MYPNLFDTILIILLLAVVVSFVFRYLHLPVVLGYIIVGTIVGPYALGWIPNINTIKGLAEFGVVFLMFTVGLEFSLSKIIALRNAVFILGALQVLLSVLITTVIGLMLDMSLLASLVCGGVVAMSSTALVTKQLTDQLEINAKHGTNAVGILLFQDLAVIPFLVIIASFSSPITQPLGTTLLWAFFKGVIAIMAILGISHWILRPSLRLIAATRSIELFTLSVLLLTLGSAWLTHKLGLSLALGAFLAGMMLGETEYRHQLEVEIRPFRDVLLGLFFISIGMLLNVKGWQDTWFWILLLLIAIMIGKMVLIILLSYLLDKNIVSSFRTGIILAHGGEFGFAILLLALTNRLIPIDYGQVILSALLLSIAFAPLIIYYNEKIASFIFPHRIKISQDTMQKDISKTARGLTDHVIICGYGRVGQNISRLLESIKHNYIAIDIDPERVANAILAGSRVTFGDSTHIDILKAAKLNKTKALLISFDNPKAAIQILDQVRQINKKIPIIVRCKDETELSELQKYGASEIITETFEESLMLGYHLLLALDITSNKASELIKSVRKEHYDLLKMVIPGTLPEDLIEGKELHEQIRSVLLSESAYAIGHSLQDLKLEELGCKVIAIRQAGRPQQKPSLKARLKQGDILILFGANTKLDKAENLLLSGIA